MARSRIFGTHIGAARSSHVPTAYHGQVPERDPMSNTDATTQEGARDFIRDIVRADLAAGDAESVVTRFPPEPNGYLHIGHARIYPFRPSHRHKPITTRV